ncbi:ATP-binding cassette domain-containing protein [Aurantimonas sp. Leaf443]|uniref:ATP-binding cassette domain-containing protein n=1 Tax=Aurantimonas sp. Leaf443 TaxID=1736378 RepID=UPI0006F6B4C3|nr:ATP-binding cassette domain-containing protein [Aurantimonas sp. Leaf443]KQT85391.1 iron-hydroxamate transporter ATP-binding subunit [Aurantimonas sp. Leaf443]
MTDPSRGATFVLSGVHKAIGGRTLLHPLTLALAPGRVTGLLGRNGSGKSTLLKMLARQDAPSGGAIRLGDRPLAAYGDRDFARRVAYLPQHPPATEGLRVRELVALGRYPWHGALGRFSAEDGRKVEEALALTDLSALAERAVDTLSGGERQRAWIAMLVAQDARCLLLDEPISALDVAHQVEVLDLVARLSRERALSVVVVLHDVNMAARFCDELLALRDGRLVARGDPESVMTGEGLERIYGIPMTIVRHPGRALPMALAG